MQVFISDKSYEISAMNLDSLRANKQIIECNQIYNALTGVSTGWKNHCVTRLWEEYEKELMYFAWCCYYELQERGKNPCKPVADVDGCQCIANLNKRITDPSLLVGVIKPTHFMKLDWWVDAMRSHLLSKAVHHYGPIWSDHPIESGYYAIDKNGDWKKYSQKN